MHDLDRSTGSHKDEFNLKIVIMSFVNASLRYGAGSVRYQTYILCSNVSVLILTTCCSISSQT